MDVGSNSPNVLRDNMNSISNLSSGDKLEIKGKEGEEFLVQVPGEMHGRKVEVEKEQEGWVKNVIKYIRENPDNIDFSDPRASEGLAVLGKAMYDYRHRTREPVTVTLTNPNREKGETWKDQIKRVPRDARLAATDLDCK